MKKPDIIAIAKRCVEASEGAWEASLPDEAFAREDLDRMEEELKAHLKRVNREKSRMTDLLKLLRRFKYRLSAGAPTKSISKEVALAAS